MNRELFASYPFLVPINKNATIIQGFLKVQGEQFGIRLHVPNTTRLDGASVEGSWKLCLYLHENQEKVNEKLKSCESVVEFLKQMEYILVSQLSAPTTSPVSLQTPAYYSRLLKELEELGWEKLAHIDADFQELVLNVTDQRNRRHELNISIPIEYPLCGPRCTTNLPNPFEFSWREDASLVELFEMFVSELEIYQDFWDQMEQIDKTTWVLEPENPQFSHRKRRVVIAENASIQISVDPRHPRLFPECVFMGSDQIVHQLQSTMQRNQKNWNVESSSILENLSAVLEVTFPSKQMTKKEDFNHDCAMCFAYHLADEIPEKACDDPRCGQMFHIQCLYEWFSSVPSNRRSRNMIFGECPFCGKGLSCRIPN